MIDGFSLSTTFVLLSKTVLLFPLPIRIYQVGIYILTIYASVLRENHRTDMKRKRDADRRYRSRAEGMALKRNENGEGNGRIELSAS